MTDVVDLFPTDGAKFWIKERIGSVRGLHVHVVCRTEHPHELHVRVMPTKAEPGFALIGSFVGPQIGECVVTGRAVLNALRVAEGAWFSDEA